MALAVLIISSCPAPGGRIYDAFEGKDKTIPCLLSYKLEDNRMVELAYDEDVTLIDIVIDDVEYRNAPRGTLFSLPVGRVIGRGESIKVYITAEDAAGNSSRAAMTLIGKNTDIPDAVINEVSIKGTGASPDRIELLFLEEGNAAGMIVSDGLPEDAQHSLILPDIAVKPYDMILIYWDSEAESKDPVFNEGSFCYIVDGGSSTTLSGTNGAILLYAESGGRILDGILYSTGSAEAADGWGNSRTRNAALHMMAYGHWHGDAIPSEDVTSSRVIARLPGGQDTDSAEDFFITAARHSTFGLPNEYIPYEGD